MSQGFATGGLLVVLFRATVLQPAAKGVSVYSLSKGVISKYIRGECKRRLRLDLYDGKAARVADEAVEKDARRPGLTLLSEQGRSFERQCFRELDGIFGPQVVGEVLRSTRRARSGHSLRSACSPHFRAPRRDRSCSRPSTKSAMNSLPHTGSPSGATVALSGRAGSSSAKTVPTLFTSRRRTVPGAGSFVSMGRSTAYRQMTGGSACASSISSSRPSPHPPTSQNSPTTA